jgi:hypothetical protein
LECPGEKGQAHNFAEMRARHPVRRIGTLETSPKPSLFAMTSTFLTALSMRTGGEEPLT